MTVDCDHEWVAERQILATNPPQQRHICTKCGKIVLVKAEATEMRDRFAEAYQKFYGDKRGTPG